MAFNVQGGWIGLHLIKKNLSDYSKKVQEQAGLVVGEGVLAIHAEARKSIQRIASKGNERPDGSFASAPGMPPNTDTGTLVRSIEFDIDMEKAKGKVFANAEYAAALEFGTKDMTERPFMAPAYAKFRDDIIKKLKKVLKSE